MAIDLAKFIGRHCPFCRVEMYYHPHMPTRDHLHPKSMGGDNSRKNLLVICNQCNNDKRARTVLGFLQKLEAEGDARARRVRKFMKENGFHFGHGGFNVQKSKKSDTDLDDQLTLDQVAYCNERAAARRQQWAEHREAVLTTQAPEASALSNGERDAS